MTREELFEEYRRSLGLALKRYDELWLEMSNASYVHRSDLWHKIYVYDEMIKDLEVAVLALR